MFKKITFVFLGIFIVGMIGFAITLPLGIRASFQKVSTLLEENTLSAEIIELPSAIDTIEFYSENEPYYLDIIIKQSPDDTAYFEIYTQNTYNANSRTISVTYPNETTAKIGTERVYGQLHFDKTTLDRTIVKELQHYPDVIFYLPARMSVKTDYPYYFETVSFQNKEELFTEIAAQEEEERIREKAEELLLERQEEEERIQEEAQRLLEEQLQQEETATETSY